MQREKNNSGGKSILRKKAEEQLKNQQSEKKLSSSEVDLQKLIHELEVHQIELELQNEELLLAKKQEELTREKYTNLFDFAPSAYFTLTEHGNIAELNLAGAQMLGKERQKLINSRLALFIGRDCRVVFDIFLKKVFSSKSPANCEVTLVNDGNVPIYALLTGTLSDDGKHCLITATDITARKIAENELRCSNEDLKLMNAINHAGNSNESLNSIIDLIANQLKVTFKSHLLSVFIPDEERREMKMLGNTLDNDLVEKIEKVIGKSIPQVVLRMDTVNPFTEIEQSRKGLLSIGKKEVTKRLAGYLSGTPWSTLVKKFVKNLLPVICDIIGYQSSAAVPMISKGKIAGYIELGSSEIMTERELARIQSIANHLATVIIRFEAESKLRESEEHMANAFNYSSIGMAFLAPDGRWLKVNSAISVMLGYTESELLSKTFQEITHPDDLPKDLDYRRQILEGVIKSYKREKRFFHKSGDIIWVSVSISLAHDYEGKPLHFISQIQDITEMKSAFDELSNAREALEFKVEERTGELLKTNTFRKAILDNAPIAIITTDSKGILQSINPAGEKMTGYTSEEVIGNITPLHFHDRDEILGYCIKKTGNPRLSESDVFPTALEDMINKSTEWHWVDKTGKKFPVKIILNSLMSSDGIIYGYIGLILEVSKEKEYLNSLLKSETENRAIVQAVPDLLFRMHRDGTFLDSHSQNDSSLYVSKELFIGKNINEVLPPELAAEAMQAIEKAFATDDVVQYEYCLPVNGKNSFFENRIISISDDEALSIIRDITERKELFQELSGEKRRLTDIIKGTNIGTWEWNIQTGEAIFNEQWAQMLGYTLDEISPVGIETWIRFAHPDDLKTSAELLEKHFKGELDYYSFESRMKHKNGDWIWVLDRGRVHEWDGDGKPLMMSGTHQDITDIKRATELESELLQLSIKLTGIPAAEIAPALNIALGRIGSFLGADRAYIFEINSAENTMTNTYEWCKEGIIGEIENLKDLPCDIFPNWMTTLNKQENIHIPSVKDLPESWRAERDILEPQGIKSLIAIPLLLDNMLIGFVGLDSVKSKKEYKKSEINTLKVWGNMLAGLINYQRKENYIELMRQNYETFFNTIDDFLFVLDEQGNIIHVNKTVTRRLGYDTSELMGKSVLMVHPAGRRDEAGRIVGEMLAGTADFCPVPLITKSGNFIPVETRVKHGFWDGKPVIFGVSKDISKIKLSEEKFSKAFQSNSALMAISTLDGIFLEVNDTFVNKLEYSRDEVIGKNSTELKLFDNPELRLSLTNLLVRNIAVRDVELRTRTKSGGEITGLFSGDMITIGEERCLLTMMVDISERKLAEVEIIKAKSESEKANQAKSEFLSRMSHELRTPLNSILGFAQLLEMGELNQKQKKGVNHIIISGKHLLDLINEVLDISRLESGKENFNIEPIELKGIINEITDSIQITANKRGISIEVEETAAGKLSINADRLRIRQILINLLNNAIKYNTENGSVKIITTQQPPDEEGKTRIRISVSDTGEGIKQEYIGKLFQPFERIGADKTEIEGSGLGLVVVKKLTEAMGGKIGVESKIGTGSTFWIELPIAESGNKAVLETSFPKLSKLSDSTKNPKILYIEDNQPNIELVEDIINEYLPGTRLVTSMYGKRTVELAKEHEPCLILLDLDLPDMKGIEVLRQLLSEEKTKAIPVIIISADAMPYQVKELMEAGAADYLTKPLDIVRFLRTIDKNIKKK